MTAITSTPNKVYILYYEHRYAEWETVEVVFATREAALRFALKSLPQVPFQIKEYFVYEK